MTEIISKEEREALLAENMANAPLEKIHLAATPSSWDEITEFCSGASTPADAATAALMAWNFAVEWHYQQTNCCDELRTLRAQLDQSGLDWEQVES